MRYKRPARVMLDKSEKSLFVAKDSLDKGYFDRCISSLYYSAFQCLNAFMLNKGIVCRTHGHAQSFLHKDLIKSGLLDVNFGRMYNTLMEA